LPPCPNQTLGKQRRPHGTISHRIKKKVNKEGKKSGKKITWELVSEAFERLNRSEKPIEDTQKKRNQNGQRGLARVVGGQKKRTGGGHWQDGDQGSERSNGTQTASGKGDVSYT